MSHRFPLLQVSPVRVDFTRSHEHERSLWWWAGVGVLEILLWIEVPIYIHLSIVVLAIGLALIARCWPILALSLYAAMEVSAHIIPNIYDRDASPGQLWPLRVGISLFVCSWLFFGYTSQYRSPVKSTGYPIALPSRALMAVLLLCAIAVDAYRYRNTGVPLLSDRIDVTRAMLSAESGLVIGLMREAWTLGMMLSIVRLILARPISIVDFVFAGSFFLGSLSGGSRNALLSGLIPALLASVMILIGVRRGARTVPPWALMTIVGVGVATVVGSYYFAGRRVLSGEGVYEQWIAGQSDGNSWVASLHSVDLSLSAPLETWSRLFDYQTLHGQQDNQLNVLGSFHFITKLFGYEAGLYDLTAQLSSPLYMNVGTIMAAPYVDFGLGGALVFVFALGAIWGLIDRRLQSVPSIYALLGRGFLVYLGVFSVYEFLPYFYPTWIPLALALYVLHWVSSVRTRLVSSHLYLDELPKLWILLRGRNLS